MKRTQKEILTLYDKYYEMVWRICLMQLGNVHDAYDAAQETFIRLIRYPKSFHDEEHEKAWMIRTSTNYCRDVLKSSFRKKQVSMAALDMETEPALPEGHREVFETMLELPEKYRVILYLYFYEGYSLKEISGILKVNASTLRSRFAKAKEIMKEYLAEHS